MSTGPRDRGYTMGDDGKTGLEVGAFPPGFLWGAATAAYQIEGASREGGRGRSIWDDFADKPGSTLHGDTGDVACDHYHRWRDDFVLLRDLGLNAYRFSLSWSRLQPGGRGKLNPVAVAHYEEVLQALVEMGVRPFVTLYHWDMPQELEDAGGWPSRDTAGRFADYATLVVRSLGDWALDWVTINEPWCSAFLGYEFGKHAPGRTCRRDALAAAHHLNLAHGLAARAVHAEHPDARVGMCHLLTDVVPRSESPDDLAAAARVDDDNNRLFLNPVLKGGYPSSVWDIYGHAGLADAVREGDEGAIAAPVDFLGVNHYQQLVVSEDPDEPRLRAKASPAEPAATSLGWSVKPESLLRALRRVHDEYSSELPLYVTENGASFVDYVDPAGEVRDFERVEYLRRYLGAAADAIRSGVNLNGYFAWSLLDNFEWAEGYRPRFGLIHVDYGTQKRTVKASGAWYREMVGLHARITSSDCGARSPARADGRNGPQTMDIGLIDGAKAVAARRGTPSEVAAPERA